MQLHNRYELLTPLAAGDFATVYRGRDVELGREVAIKQVHAQFLNDPRQLDLYWREAQLLASVEHPHIMTIYDIVRQRGWLILELMQGTVHEMARGEPLDLDFLREVLASSLKALSFLHSRGVVHGDVKPTNLFVDRRGQVKLGDFGLARRVTSDRGSLLKGTTKYMAPELADNRYGSVGPHSDLYSLGFAAYELMCGANFESLFPGIPTAGPEKQVFWLMWHAAPDRRLPEISRILEGVPPDIAKVIERLTQKHPQQRYHTAEEALRDLQMPANSLVQEIADNEAVRKQQVSARRKRIAALAGVFLSVAASVALWFFLSQPEPEKPKPKFDPIKAEIRRVLPEERTLFLAIEGLAKPKEQKVSTDDEIIINDKVSDFSDLRESDQIIIDQIKDEKGKLVRKLSVQRPREDRGVIDSINVPETRLTLALGDEAPGSKLEVNVGTAKLQLNESAQFNGKPLQLKDFKKGDRVAVNHYWQNQVHIARTVSALRTVPDEGTFRNFDTKKQLVSFALESNSGSPADFPLGTKCEVTLNGLQFLSGKLLTPADLQAGDRVKIEHDTHVTRIDAQREFNVAGQIKNIRYDVRSIELAGEGGATQNILVAPNCTVKLGTETVAFDDLRRGDRVTLTHDSADAKNLTALTLDATRPTDPTRAIVIIANETFDDATLGQFTGVKADADLLADTLGRRYGVAPEQIQVLTNESRIRLEQGIPQVLDKVRGARQLFVYYTGATFVDEERKVYLCPKEFQMSQIKTVGLPLKWFIDKIEACPAERKLLLFDAVRGAVGGNSPRQPSAAEMIETIRGTRKAPGLRTLTVIASCSLGERGRDSTDRQHGAFAMALAECFAGAGDKNRDLSLEIAEIYDYLKVALADGSKHIGGPQTPALIVPETTPPRISEEAKVELQHLADLVEQPKFDLVETTRAYDAAQRLIGKQPEARLLYALAMWRAYVVEKDKKKAEQHSAALLQLLTELRRVDTGRQTLPYELYAFHQFEKNDLADGLNTVSKLLSRLDTIKDLDRSSPQITALAEWAGRMREYATTAAVTNAKPADDTISALDALAGKFGAAAQKGYLDGRAAVNKKAQEFDQDINNQNLPETERFQKKIERRRLKYYLTFPAKDHIQRILSGLDTD